MPCTSTGLGQILDTVPNHMAVGTNDNPWWNDVLENGPASRYAAYFDIAWRSSLRPELSDKVLLTSPRRSLRRRARSWPVHVSFMTTRGFSVEYAGRDFPDCPAQLCPDPGASLWKSSSTAWERTTPALIELKSVLTAVRNLPGSSETEPDRVDERQREKEVIKRRLAALADQSQPIRDWIDLKSGGFQRQARRSREFRADG